MPLFAWLFFTSMLPWSDHFYRVCTPATAQGAARPGDLPPPCPAPNPPTAQALPAATPASGPAAATPLAAQTSTPPSPSPTPAGDSIILVAANGGGIQAGAWAARVLTGLEKELRKEFGDRFGKSIRVVSSVSGGSVGAMYFVNEYDEHGNLPSDEELEKIVKRAEGSSLDEVAWGLVYPDFARPLLPFPLVLNRTWDRGRALEEAWLRNDAEWSDGRRENILRGLSAWAADAQARRRPGSIFNTTIADTGDRLPLATIEMPAGSQGRRAFDELFKEYEKQSRVRPDIPVVTAARLSASFPYVSPAARADLPGGAAHIVDGGYYDNYGISSLVEWLDAELSRDGNNIRRVLVLQLLGAPTDDAFIYGRCDLCQSPSDRCDVCEPTGRRDVYRRESERGWFYQMFAPVATLIHVRDTGQLSHSEVELNLLIEKWKYDRDKQKAVEIVPVVFEFDGADPPLSWHLTAREKRAIECVWQAKLKNCGGPADRRPPLEEVKEFLRRAGGTP